MTVQLPPSVQPGCRPQRPRTADHSRPLAPPAEVYLHGAHVTAWQPTGADPVIWVSADSQFHPDKPIRGGVPICFPWFAAHATDASAPMHGFARLRDWTLGGVEDRDGEVHVTFRLTDDDTSRRSAWPHPFTADYRITFGDRLALALDVANTGDAAADLRGRASHLLRGEGHSTGRRHGARGHGVSRQGRRLSDASARATRRSASPARPTASTSRPRAPAPSTTRGLRRRIEIAKTGSQSTIVWNPWIDKARAMPDFGDDEWPSMLCIETANVRDAAVRLEPGSHHTMTAVVAIRGGADSGPRGRCAAHAHRSRKKATREPASRLSAMSSTFGSRSSRASTSS